MKQGIFCITGSTDGIGRAAAFELAAAGSAVILHGRCAQRLEETKREIARQTGSERLMTVQADFSDLSQVRKMAGELLSSLPRIDALINNAGVYMHECELTDAGVETTFGVNYLAHFLLTLELEPLLVDSRSRIVNVSSVDHYSADYSPDYMIGRYRFSGYYAYAFSKLCNVAFTVEHAERLRGTGVTVNTLDPGILATKLLHAGWNLIGADVSCGAPPLLYLACSNDVEGVSGLYFENNHPSICSSKASDPDVRAQLWQISEEIVRQGGEG
ncbi:SDR family NAD(P)-dependent oxidoreductase [Prosthecochloris sp. ZM_2]|uniref:SDR family NAD(P)-dependent oxidoreductase n=1 Tax=Prosthecochloris sp. ZM_2 TaxID=2045206 RepID=UPI000DF833F2|nr:SDR family NAD(P)-dependent oxidoreductase [Prosthecochloris sp. ZM_2]RNA68267.1 SDR family NAD(P)-dependent oxidoreductase [Prosthecochloris sp. ZM_2]